MYTLVLIRHGQSVWNKANKFTGWTDVDLSEQGIKEAQEAGRILKKKDYHFDIAFTSVLKRATETLSLVLEEMDLVIPIKQSWRLNERHYGALQGLNKDEMRKKVGKEQVQKWRRSFATRPPALDKKDPRYPGNDPLYEDLDENDIPACESLKDTIKRVLPYWKQEIVPIIRDGQKVIISAHGNSLRALVKHIDGLGDDEVVGLEIPTGNPMVYELDKELKPINKFYLKNQ